MTSKFGFVNILLMLIVLSACATSNHLASYRNPELSNFNPAPKSMSPPQSGAEDTVVDPTHLRTQADYHYALGEALSFDGESDKAVEEFKLALVYDVNSASIRLRLGTEYLRQGLLTEAVEQAEQAEKLEPENVAVNEFLGSVYGALKMYKQAGEKYQNVMRKDPNNKDVPMQMGALLVEQEQFDAAETYFMKASKTEDGDQNHMAYYYVGKMRLGQGAIYFKQAEKAFIQCLQIKPDFEEGALALYELYSARDEKPRALKLLESFQDQFGPKKSVAYQLGQYYLEKENYEKAFKHLQVLESFEQQNLNVKVKIALILIEQKKYDEAIDKLEQIIVLAPSSDKIRFYLAAVYEETGKHDLAIQNFNRIESTSTYFAEAVVHSAYLYRKKQDLDAASRLLQKSIAARDDVPQFYAFYASLLDERREYKAGSVMLEQATKKFPDNTQLRFYLGSMYDRLGRQEDMIAEMRKVLSVDEKHVQALNYLAYTFAESGKNLDEAESMARSAMKLQPNDGYILDTVGWVIFKQGRVEEAIQYLETAHRLRPEESIIAEHLGDAYYVYELSDKAKQMYLKAVSFEKDQEKVVKIKAKLDTLVEKIGSRLPASTKGN